MIDKHLYDLTVIGGGPVGMFTTFYAGLRQSDVQLIESLPQLGGQVSALYPEKKIYDVAGFAGISGQKLIDELKIQLQHFQPTIKLNTAVTQITRLDQDKFEITTNTGTTYSKAIIIAIGNGPFSPRKLAADYAADLENDKIFYQLPHPSEFQDQKVAIAGGGDSAIDWALALENIASEVHIIHRRNQFRGLEADVAELKKGRTQIHTPFLVNTVAAANNGLDLTLKKIRTEETETLNVDKLLVAYGFSSDNRLLRTWPVELEHNQVVVDSEMTTSTPGIYAIGDSASYPGKVKLIASGFGEAPTAVSAALNYIYPERRQPLHSTDLYR